MKKITVLCAITCATISNNACGMLLQKTKSIVSKKNIIRRTEFNRAELLQELQEQQHRFSKEQMAFLNSLISKRSIELTEERIAMPGKAKDRDFPHGNMNKE